MIIFSVWGFLLMNDYVLSRAIALQNAFYSVSIDIEYCCKCTCRLWNESECKPVQNAISIKCSRQAASTTEISIFKYLDALDCYRNLVDISSIVLQLHVLTLYIARSITCKLQGNELQHRPLPAIPINGRCAAKEPVQKPFGWPFCLEHVIPPFT